MDLLFFAVIAFFPSYFWLGNSFSLCESIFYFAGLTLIIDSLFFFIFKKGPLSFLLKKEIDNPFNKYLLMFTALTLLCLGSLSYRIDKPLLSVTEQDSSDLESLPSVSIKTDAFPRSPDHYRKTMSVPGKSIGVKYDQYTCKHPVHDIQYSVSAVKVPKNLLRWGHSLVLKGSMKMLIDAEPHATLLQSQKGSYRGHPCIDYVIRQQNKEYRCRIMLANGILYKLEIQYPGDLREVAVAEADGFFSSFIPDEA